MAHKRKYYETRRENFLPNGVPRYVRCYDDGESIDRYTAVFAKKSFSGSFFFLTMNAAPFHPQGFGQHGETRHRPADTPEGVLWPPAIGKKNHLGTRITFEDLPEDCRKLVIQDYEYYWDLRPYDENDNPLPLPEK